MLTIAQAVWKELLSQSDKEKVEKEQEDEMRNGTVEQVRKDFVVIANAVSRSLKREPPRYTKEEVRELERILTYWQLEDDKELRGALEL